MKMLNLFDATIFGQYYQPFLPKYKMCWSTFLPFHFLCRLAILRVILWNREKLHSSYCQEVFKSNEEW